MQQFESQTRDHKWLRKQGQTQLEIPGKISQFPQLKKNSTLQMIEGVHKKKKQINTE